MEGEQKFIVMSPIEIIDIKSDVNLNKSVLLHQVEKNISRDKSMVLENPSSSFESPGFYDNINDIFQTETVHTKIEEIRKSPIKRIYSNKMQKKKII